MGCGMALNLNGLWGVRQRFPHQRKIVRKYPEKFKRTTVADSVELDWAVTD